MKVAVDLMGGEVAPKELIDALHEYPLGAHERLLILAHESLRPQFQGHHRIEFVACQEWVGMDESPLLVARRKRNSSMAIGLKLLKEGKADALVTAGNTGALVAMSRLFLGCLPPLKRPCLLAELPTISGTVAVLDVGANLDCKPHQLVQFARLGATFQSKRNGLIDPRVGLLNIGTESQKGTVERREAFRELEKAAKKSHGGMQFIGNVEGNEVFTGKVDVLVTDGFIGNIFLKTSEGVCGFVLDYIGKLALKHQGDSVFAKDLRSHLSYAEYCGALLLGLPKLVIKVHGYSEAQAFISGIKGAFRLVLDQFTDKFSKALQALSQQHPS